MKKQSWPILTLLFLCLHHHQFSWSQATGKSQDARVAAERNFSACRTVTLNLIDTLHDEKCPESMREKALELYLDEALHELPTEPFEKFEAEVTKRIEAQSAVLGQKLRLAIANKAIANSHLVRTKEAIISLGENWDGKLYGRYIDALFSVSDVNDRGFSVSEIQSNSTVPSLVKDLKKWLNILEVTFKDVGASKQEERDKLLEQIRTTIRRLEQDQVLIERVWKKVSQVQ